MLTFNFNGVESSLHKIYMRRMPDEIAPEHEYDFEEAADRDGSIIIDQKRYRDIETELELYLDDESYIDGAIAYLQGSGEIIFSKVPDRAWKITFVGPVRMERILRGMRQRLMTIPVRFQPFRYIYPAASAITIRASGGTINNPGTYWAQSRIQINGSGAFAITISCGGEMSAMFFSQVPSGGIIIDTELMDAFNAAGTALKNNCILSSTEDFLRIYPGINTITWSTGGEDESGAISSITITPRWRNL